MTITEQIKQIQEEIKNTKDLTPGRASEILAELSALRGNVLDEVRKRDAEYRQVLRVYLESERSVNKATVIAECSPEYDARIRARHTDELVKEMIRSLKYYLREKESEYRESY